MSSALGNGAPEKLSPPAARRAPPILCLPTSGGLRGGGRNRMTHRRNLTESIPATLLSTHSSSSAFESRKHGEDAGCNNDGGRTEHS